MQIKDMTEQELKALDNYFGDPDEGKEVKQAFRETLLEIQRKRKQGRQKISAEEEVTQAIKTLENINKEDS